MAIPPERRGGCATRDKYGHAYLREIASRGGKRTKELHGSEHFSRAGRAGWEAMVNRYFNGDEAAAKTWLTNYGQWVQDPMPGNGAFEFPGYFPYGDNPPGKMSLDDWEKVWDEYFD